MAVPTGAFSIGIRHQWLAEKLMKNAKKQEEKELLSSYELSLRDLDEGRVYKYDSLDDLIKEIEG